MSHYTKVKTKITRKSALVKALQNMGFKANAIEIHETPVPLRGYGGDTRKQVAHVRLKGAGWRGENVVGGASNDLGWEKLEDGSYGFHVSNYDRGKYNEGWQKKLAQQYSKEVIKEVAEENGFYIESETTEDGEILIEAVATF